MRKDKVENTAVRALTSEEILAVSGGIRLKVPHSVGGAARQGGRILGEIFGEIFGGGRRVRIEPLAPL